MLNIIACGKFHYPKYLKYLENEKLLDAFYCSYKIGANFHIPASKVKNQFFKEYILNAHLKLFGDAGLNATLFLYHRAWEKSTAKLFQPAKINQFLIHGNCSALIQKCKTENYISVGEVVNAHPKFQSDILEEEAKQRGLNYSANTRVIEKMLGEIDAVDYLLCPSKFVKQTFKRFGFKEEKMIVIPYGVERPSTPSDVKREYKNLSSKRDIRVLCVGQIMLRKGQYYLVEAIKNLNRKSKSQKFHLTLVGSSERNYMECVKSLGEKFDYMPHIDNNKMIEFMQSFDIFVMPSLEDGFGVVVSEALSAGLPVVLTKNAGAVDIIEDEKNGVVIEPANSAHIEEAIIKIIDDQMIGSQGEKIDWKDYAAKLISGYKTLL